MGKRGKHLLEIDTPNGTSLSTKDVQTKDGAKDKKSKKLSYKLQRELDELPAKIEHLEGAIQQLTDEVEKSDFYQQPFDKSKQVLKSLSITQSELDQAIERWAKLEGML